MNREKRKNLFTAAVFILLLLFLLFSQGTAAAAKSALTLVLSRVLPSLLPFMVLSGILLRLDRAGERNGKGSRRAVFFGFFCGVPVGASLLADLEGEEKEQVLPLASLLSPSFCVSFLGGTYGSPLVGALLFLSSLLAALLAHRLLHKKRTVRNSSLKKETAGSLSLPVILTGAVGSAASSSGSVAVCVVFFSCLSSALGSLAERVGAPAPILPLLSGLLEVSSGCASALSLPRSASLPLCAFFVGFGGLSAAFQSLAAAKTDKLLPYLLEKLLTGALSLFFFLFFSLFQ